MTPEEQKAKAIIVSSTIDRLEITYSDFIQNHKGHDAIPSFFREHLYSPANKEARDQALDNLYEKLKSVTGPEMTENIHKLIVLNKLTDELDLDAGRALLDKHIKAPEELDTITRLPQETLVAAIKDAGNFENRRKQVAMVADSLGFFFSLSKIPLIKLVMAPIKIAASLVGATELVTTMEAGYDLSRKIKDMKPFTQAFIDREIKLVDDLDN